jgi:hypothetical protein
MGVFVLIGLAGCGDATGPAPAGPAAVSDSAPQTLDSSAVASADQVRPQFAAGEAPVAATSSEADALFATLASQDSAPDDWEQAQARLLELGEASVPTLARELGSADDFRREVAASGLAMLGPVAAPATAALRKALADGSVHVRANAATALCAIPEQADVVIPVLTALLLSDDPQVRQMSAVNLSSFGEEAAPYVPQLAAALETAPDDVLVQVVELLGRIGPEAESATPRLQQIVFEQEGEAKQAASAALERISAPPAE